MRIIDLHCDTMMWHMDNPKHTLQDNVRHINEDKLKTGQAFAQCFALFVPADRKFSGEEIIEDCYRRYNKLYEFYIKDLSMNNAWLAPAECMNDFWCNEKSGKISSVLTLEDGTFIGNKIERLEEAYKRGARMLGLTWNTENEIGYPNSCEQQKHMLGLKPFGFEVIAKMNELGMVVDVSHLSEGGFWDVANYSKKPFVASHSCANSICNHQRNLTDEQLKAIGETGGVVGVNYMTLFVNKEASLTHISDVIRHVKHMVNVAGIESVALGSDFDGMGDSKLEFGDYAGCQKIVDALLEEYTEKDVEKICKQNALRIFNDCWK